MTVNRVVNPLWFSESLSCQLGTRCLSVVIDQVFKSVLDFYAASKQSSKAILPCGHLVSFIDSDVIVPLRNNLLDSMEWGCAGDVVSKLNLLRILD